MSSSILATAPEGLTQQADQACGACKKHKRRCDKAIPECSLCHRAGRTCIYPEAPESMPTAAMFAALRERLQELEERVDKPPITYYDHGFSPAVSRPSLLDRDIASHNSNLGTPSMLGGQEESEFPAALFLDIDCFTWAGLKLPDPPVPIPVVSTIFWRMDMYN